MNLYKLNRSLHRDLGYFFIGVTLIYAISGIAINHRDDWNPNYIITAKEFYTSEKIIRYQASREQIDNILARIGEKHSYKNHYFPKADLMRIFIEGGRVEVELSTGNCLMETNRKRPFFFQVNKLHYNPGVLWMWFSDAFCVALAFLAISGLFILKGKNGLKWRGTIIGGLGLLVTIAFLVYYL